MGAGIALILDLAGFSFVALWDVKEDVRTRDTPVLALIGVRAAAEWRLWIFFAAAAALDAAFGGSGGTTDCDCCCW